MSLLPSNKTESSSPLQPVLEESPVLRLHSEARARAVRRALAIALTVVVLVALAWAAWYAWSVRGASSSMLRPMRADKGAIGRLAAEGSDVSLVVVRPTADSTSAAVAVLRQPEKSAGSWLLVLPAAILPTSDAANETPSILLRRGRASLMKAVEALIEARFRHYVEVDWDGLSPALGVALSGGSKGANARSAASASTSSASASPSSTIAALAVAARRYQQKRSGLLGILRLPMLAQALRGSAVSDLSATGADAMLRRLGADASAGKMRIATVPTQLVDKKRVTSTMAAGIFATRMLAGQGFGTVAAGVKRVSPALVTVTVLNGAGRGGVAAQAARMLQRAGYRVRTVGNANQFVYDKTLIVYDKKRINAESVANDLHRGRVVPSRGMYSFNTDVLVIVGGDWPKAP